jgi:hypothetical protein
MSRVGSDDVLLMLTKPHPNSGAGATRVAATAPRHRGNTIPLHVPGMHKHYGDVAQSSRLKNEVARFHIPRMHWGARGDSGPCSVTQNRTLAAGGTGAALSKSTPTLRAALKDTSRRRVARKGRSSEDQNFSR